MTYAFPLPTASVRSVTFAVLTLMALMIYGAGGVMAQQGLIPSAPAAEPAPDPSADPAAAALAPLLDVLRDDTARAALIAELEKATAATEPMGDAPTTDSPAMSLGGRIAVLTQDVAQTAAAQGAALWGAVSNAGSVFDGLQGDELTVLYEALRSLFLVIVLTVAVFLALRAVAIPFFRKLGKRAREATFIRKILLFAGSFSIDALIVVVAWAIGYLVAVLALGDFGQIAFRQSLYLNAFLLVEMVKVVMRSIISPSAGGLRILPISDKAARRLNRVVTVVVTILGYGQLLILPIVNQNVSYAAGQGVSALLSVIVVLYLVFVVVRYRKLVAGWLHDRMTPRQIDADGADVVASEPHGIAAVLGHNWHWLALAYLVFMFIAVMSQTTEVVFAYLAASAKIAAAIILANALFESLSKTVAKGVSLPGDVSQKLPLLEPRLNSFVPKVLLVVRYAVALMVALFVLDTAGAIHLRGWMESRFGLQLTGTLVSVGLVLLVAYGIWLAMTSWVDYRLNPDYGSVPTARETTLLSLLRNAVTIAIFILTMMFCLSEIGLDIGPLLASAGVLGLAIGFGAQKMVQDIITGVFIQFENAINVGDVITVGGITGGVEKLTVRSVSLRDVHGVFHIIPFSSVDMVSNFTRDFSFFVCDMGVAYRENIEDVRQAMLDSFDELKEDPEQAVFLLGDLEWYGVNAFGDSAVVCRARIKTLPGKQWGVGRAYNGILKRIFDERGIEIPFPHQTIFFGEAKDGSTQKIRLAQPDATEGETTDTSEPTKSTA